MTKQDYELMAANFAQELRKAKKSPIASYAIQALIGAFCQIAKRDNRNFDEGRFRLVCGV